MDRGTRLDAGARPPGWRAGAGAQRSSATGRRLDAVRQVVDNGAKLRDGRKPHVLTDTWGLLLEVTVTPANVHDSVVTPDLLASFMAAPGRLPEPARADSAYQGQALAQAFARHGVNAEVVRRSDGQTEFVVLARR